MPTSENTQTIVLPTNFTKINAAAFAIDIVAITGFAIQELSLSKIIFNGRHLIESGYPQDFYWFDIGV